MGNGLLSSMAITDAFEIAALKQALHEKDRIIDQISNEYQKLLDANAGNLYQKILLKQRLGTLWPIHPLLNIGLCERLDSKAAKIINTAGASWDDVREAAYACTDDELKEPGFGNPPRGTMCVVPPVGQEGKWLVLGGWDEQSQNYVRKVLNPAEK